MRHMDCILQPDNADKLITSAWIVECTKHMTLNITVDGDITQENIV